VIWLTWRQFRGSALFVAMALAVMAILLGLTPQGGALTQCFGHSGCPVGDRFLGLSHVGLLKYLSTLLVGLPALVGGFWGAPLIARELETGTYRLAWTQSVTRTRWLAVKVGSIAVACAVVCGLLSLMLMRWSSTSINSDRLQPAMFAERGIVPVGYAVFALAVGVVAGLLIRRTVPAMAVTFLVFLGTRMAVQFGLRPHLAPQKHLATAIGQSLDISNGPSGLSLFAPSANIPGGWTLSNRIVNNAGHAPSHAFVQGACGQVGPPPQASPTSHVSVTVQHGFTHCVTAVAANFHVLSAYQPASHYWALQWAETGLYVGLAVALVGFCFWWVHRRLN
jgi:ABC-type transport system involved in multi-copper enzyme maturation permease subunit